MKEPKLLITEDEIIVAEDLRSALVALGYRVVGIVDTADDSVAMAERTRPDLVLMDIKLRGTRDGIAAAEQIHRDLGIPVVFLTAHADAATLTRARSSYPFGYLVKPFEEQGLRASIEMALQLHQTQRSLRETELWLATTLRSIGDGVIAVDLEGRVSFLNAKAEKLTGWSMAEARGRPIQEIFKVFNAVTGEPLPNPVLQALSQGDELVLGHDALLRQASGSSLPIEDSVAPIRTPPTGATTGAVVVFRDASARRDAEAERRRMQQKLEDSRRLESLGMLASGIAHDFNNLLTAILANADLGKLDLPSDSRAYKHLQQIEAAALRAAELCRQMLAGAGLARRSVTTCDLNTLVEETIRGLRPSLTGQVAIERNLRPDLPKLKADPGQLRQVITNLVINAYEALEGRPGVVRIRTDKIYADRALLSGAIHGEDLAEGNYLLLEVGDSGCGMAPEAMARVCEPFYTTKFMGRGMGMAAVSGIVRAHEGALRIQSELGNGSVFSVYLPIGTLVY